MKKQAGYRHEMKYMITEADYRFLKPVLASIMQADPHADENGEYNIRSLYLDDMYRTAYQQKMDGVEIRKKYRVRIYNCSDHSISLECKHKNGPFILKESVKMTPEEYRDFLQGDYGFLLKKGKPIAGEFFADARINRIRPWVIVEYDREPFIYDVGTVRITFDKGVRAMSPSDDMFSPDAPSYEILPPGMMILEVKFTGKLPEKIRQVLRSCSFTQTNASKFCMCADKLDEVGR